MTGPWGGGGGGGGGGRGGRGGAQRGKRGRNSGLSLSKRTPDRLAKQVVLYCGGTRRVKWGGGVELGWLAGRKHNGQSGVRQGWRSLRLTTVNMAGSTGTHQSI